MTRVELSQHQQALAARVAEELPKYEIIRGRVGAIVLLRELVPGISDAQIARAIGCSCQNVWRCNRLIAGGYKGSYSRLKAAAL
jgi:hypothetical protein